MKMKQEKERFDRLSLKTLDWQFQQEAIDRLSCSPLEAKAPTKIVKEVYLEKKDPVQVARETDHSPEAVGKYCQQFNKVKWCVENVMGKEEIRIVTGMKTHLIDEYLKIIGEHNATFPP
ncbi:MAG: DUF1670 domain-containing protein [Proteobacteria bacterium]|nr:DUF1670 domain-containing protein [Pseudomonadota bacterium]